MHLLSAQTLRAIVIVLCAVTTVLWRGDRRVFRNNELKILKVVLVLTWAAIFWINQTGVLEQLLTASFLFH